MKKTGEMLRKAREEKNLSVLEIGLSLKINSKILSAIEDGDLERLPAKTFLRGFVQSYANYLKMNSDEVLAVFTEEMGTTRPHAKIPRVENGPVNETESKTSQTSTTASPTANEVSATSTASRRTAGADKEAGLSGLEDRSRTKALILSAVCVFLVILIFSTKKVIERYQRESITSQVEVAAPLPETKPAEVASETQATTESAPPATETENTATTATTETASTNAPAATAPVSPVLPIASNSAALVKKEVAATAAPSTPPAQTSAAAPHHPTPPAATTPPPKPAVAAPTPPVATTAVAEKPKEEPKKVEAKPAEKPAAATVAATTETPAEKPVEKKPKAKSLELIVEALDTVSMEYSNAAGETQKLNLEAGKVHTIRSQNGLKLNVNNGGAVNLILNGRDLGAPGDNGKPVTLTY